MLAYPLPSFLVTNRNVRHSNLFWPWFKSVHLYKTSMDVSKYGLYSIYRPPSGCKIVHLP